MTGTLIICDNSLDLSKTPPLRRWLPSPRPPAYVIISPQFPDTRRPAPRPPPNSKLASPRPSSRPFPSGNNEPRTPEDPVPRPPPSPSSWSLLLRRCRLCKLLPHHSHRSRCQGPDHLQDLQPPSRTTPSKFPDSLCPSRTPFSHRQHFCIEILRPFGGLLFGKHARSRRSRSNSTPHRLA